MNDLCRASYNCGGQVAFVFRLPAGQVEFSGLFLTLIWQNLCIFTQKRVLKVVLRSYDK